MNEDLPEPTSPTIDTNYPSRTLIFMSFSKGYINVSSSFNTVGLGVALI
jgi:hypothetical protein